MDVSLLAAGATIEWSAAFRGALAELSESRGLAGAVPEWLAAVPLRSEGVLLVWPGSVEETDSYPVHVSPGGRRVTTQLDGPFAHLGVSLPHGIVIEVPVGPYFSPKYGHCLALSFQRATFLYRRSKGSAIGRQE